MSRAKLLLALAFIVAAPSFARPGIIATPVNAAMPLHTPNFGSMSEAGRRTMTEAMGGNAPNGMLAGRLKTDAARDKLLALIDADRLDVAALRRAMAEERQIADDAKARRQASLLVAFQKLSPADRKAFVADARMMRERVEKRMSEKRSGQR